MSSSGAVVQELGAQLGRMGATGAKVRDLLAMVAFDGEHPNASERRDPLPAGKVRRVIEHELGGRLRDLFAEFDDEPAAAASLGQVHRAWTDEGEAVAVKIQHAGVAEAIEADLRSLSVLAPILGRVAPGLDPAAIIAEVRERISEGLDYEIEAQAQRRVQRLYRGHPHVRVPGVRSGLSTRRVLVTEWVDGRPVDHASRVSEPVRDRVGEIVMRFFFGLVSRRRLVTGQPRGEDILICADGRVCFLDYGFQRDLDADYLAGERAVAVALIARDAGAVHDGLAALDYLPDGETFEPEALLEHLAAAGEWLFAAGFHRLGPEDLVRVVAAGYPPSSPWLTQMCRQRIPPPTLLLRRMELLVLAVLAQLRAGGDWGAIAAEYWTEGAATTELGREDAAFFARG